MLPIINFIKQQWLGTILIFLFALFFVYGIQKKNELLLERSYLEKEIKVLKKREESHWTKLDSLKINKNTIIQKEKTLIQLEHDTIKIIDTIAFSKLQGYFSDRYSKEDSIK